MQTARRRIHVRHLGPRNEDIEAVVQIGQGVYIYPPTEDSVLDQLEQKKVTGIIAEIDTEANRRTVGYLIYAEWSDHFVIKDIAVDQWHQRAGVGRELLNHLFSKLTRKRTRIGALVNENYTDAHLFLKSMGFRATEIIPSPFLDNNDNAYEFWFTA
jgi:ribosomal protein S18 acetylase RimI-like enzyme